MSYSTLCSFNSATCEHVCFVCMCDPWSLSHFPSRGKAPCHNLCLKNHKFFSTRWQRWHFMFTTIISLVNDSCGCGAYESFREQTETLMLTALYSFTGRCFKSQTECLGNRINSDVIMGIITLPASSSLFYLSDLFSKHF